MTDEIERVALAINGPHDSTHIGAEELLRLQKVRWDMTPSSEKQNCLTQARAALEAMQPDDDGNMLTIAYLAGAHDAKSDDRPITRQEAAKMMLDEKIENSLAKSMAHFLTVNEWEGYQRGVKEYIAALRAIAGEDKT